MKYYTVYTSSGKITKVVNCGEANIGMQLSEGESFLEGHALPNIHYVDNGVINEIPAKPSGNYWVFDYALKQWIDPRTLSDLKQTKWQEIKSQRSSIESEGFSCYNKVFDSDAISQSRIQGAVQLAQLAISTNQPFLITWTLRDNSTIDLDANQMIEVGIALGAHIANTHTRARELRALIEQANSKEELDLISW